jgi:hypothetical protein
MRFKEWDEFSFWGTSVKSLFLFDQVSPYAEVPGSFPEYLPGLPMLPYLAVKANGFWRESLVYWSYQVFILSILAALISRISWEKWKTLSLAVSIILLASTMYYNTFQSVYADPIMGILFGYSIVLATSKLFIANYFNFFVYVLFITYMALIKDIGIYFALVSVIILFFRTLMYDFSGETKSWFSLLRATIFASVALLPAVLYKFAWGKVLEVNKIVSDRSLFEILPNFFKGFGSNSVEPYWSEVTSNFINRTINGPLTTTNWAQFSSIHWIIIFSFLLLILSRKNRKQDRHSGSAVPALILIIGFFGYLYTLHFLYLNIFTKGEALGLVSFDRYVATYFAGLAIYVSYKVFENLSESGSTLKMESVSVLWIIMLLLQSNPSNLISYFVAPNYESDIMRNGFAAESWKISEMNFSAKDRVWIITQHSVGFEFFLMQYEILPAKVGKIPFSIGTPSSEGDIWTDASYTAQKWDKALEDFDYVFLQKVTDSFIDDFGQLFQDVSDIKTPAIYRVNHGQNGNTLEKVR